MCIRDRESTELGLEMRSSNVVSLSAYYTEKINTPYFEVEEDTPLGDKLSNQLGYSSIIIKKGLYKYCLLYTSPSPRDRTRSRMPSSA